MLASSALDLDRDLLQAMEAVQVIAGTKPTNRLSVCAKTILWPNRTEARQLCAKRACDSLTNQANRRWPKKCHT